MATVKQCNFIQKLIYANGGGFHSSCKYGEEAERLSTEEASRVIDYIKTHGLDDITEYEDGGLLNEILQKIN